MAATDQKTKKAQADRKKAADEAAANSVDIRSIPKIEPHNLTQDQRDRIVCTWASIGENGLADCTEAALMYQKITRTWDSDLIKPESFLRNLNRMSEQATDKWREQGKEMGVDRESLALPGGKPAFVQRNGEKLKKGSGRKRKVQEAADDGSPDDLEVAGTASAKKRKVVPTRDDGSPDGMELNGTASEKRVGACGAADNEFPSDMSLE